METCGVIVVSYNALPYSKIFYETYKRYTLTDNIQLVWVDNNSSDGTREWLQERDVDHLILLDDNHGAAWARDIAIREIDTDAICFIDNDIAVTQVGWINRLMRVLYSDLNIGAVAPAFNLIFDASQTESFTERIDPLWARIPSYKRKDSSVFHHEEDVQPYIDKYLTVLKKQPFNGPLCLEGGGTTMRRSTYLDSIGYSKEYVVAHEGYRMGKGLSLLGLKTWIVPSVFLFHYGHATRNLEVMPDFHQRVRISQAARERWKMELKDMKPGLIPPGDDKKNKKLGWIMR